MALFFRTHKYIPFLPLFFNIIVMTRSKNREEIFEKMNNLYNSNDIERTTTFIVGKTIKDDQRIFFNINE